MISDASRVSRPTLLLFASIHILAIVLVSPLHAQDPVWDFIIAADSINKAGDEAALARFTGENSILVGAAVHELIDSAIIVGDQGSAVDEKDNMELAELIARIYLDVGGDPSPLELVGVYRAWTPEQRMARANAKALEEQSAEARKARDFEKAADLLGQALDIYGEIGDSYSEAIVYGSYGVLYWHADDFDAVFEYYRKALSARRAIGNSILEGRTLNGLGSAHNVYDRFDSAAFYYNMAIDVRRRTGDLSGLLSSVTYLGNTYLKQGRLNDARNVYEEAAGILERTGGNVSQQIDLLNSMASLYSDMGRLGRSNEVYRAALEKAVSLYGANPEFAAQAEISIRMNIATNLMKETRYREAMRELDAVRLLLERYPDPVTSAAFARNLGQAYYEMGELDHARDNWLLYLRMATELEAPGMEMEALINIGYLYMTYGAPDRALTFADSALVKAERAGNLTFLRKTHVLSAELRTETGDHDIALSHWEKALEIDSAQQAEGYMIVDGMGIANVYALKGENERAREKYLEALPRIRSSGLSSMEEPLWFGVAHTYEKDSPDSARFYYEKALSLLEEAGFQTSSAELGTGFHGNGRYYYEEVARFYAGMAARTRDDMWSCEAFRTIERSKARGLLEMLQNSIAGEHSLAEEALLDSIYSLDPQSAGYRGDLEKLERCYRVLKDERLGSATGKLVAGGEVSGLEDVRKALPRKTVVFSYALGDSASQLWVIDRNGHELHELPGRRELMKESELMVQAVKRPGAGDDAFITRSRRLYDILIAPGGERLDKASELVIVPDGCLFGIPFEALLTGDSSPGADWKDMPFLFRSYNTVYSPSASCFLWLRNKKYTKKYEIDLLAVGDPDYSGADTGSGRPLRPLPNTRTEVEGIGRMFDEDEKIVLVGPAATEETLKKNISEHPSRLIHIAAHGLVDPVTPAASSIALCTEPGSGEDGYLHTLEILALPVNSRLVVLSACETATGRIGRGEGVVGLSRAFLCSGASAVVSSLWAVPDESTALLMEIFYENMTGKEKSAVRAMREARGKLLETAEYSHPFHWASFITIGTDRAPW